MKGADWKNDVFGPPAWRESPDVPSASGPKWTTEEVDCIVLAFDACKGSPARFHAEFNDITPGRQRTIAELRLHLPRVAKARGIEVAQKFLDDCDAVIDGVAVTVPAPMLAEESSKNLLLSVDDARRSAGWRSFPPTPDEVDCERITHWWWGDRNEDSDNMHIVHVIAHVTPNGLKVVCWSNGQRTPTAIEGSIPPGWWQRVQCPVLPMAGEIGIASIRRHHFHASAIPKNGVVDTKCCRCGLRSWRATDSVSRGNCSEQCP